MGVVDDVKGILSVSLKKVRYDTYTDQFSRILMVRIMMVGTLIIGLNWANDGIKCIVPSKLEIDGGYVSSACWINGFYVYEEIRNHTDDIGHYGVPMSINHNGKLPSGHLCEKIVRGKPTPGCQDLTKTFFLQYQYLVFIVAFLAGLYYSPYLLFKYVNADFISLKDNLADDGVDLIVKNYFNHSVNSPKKMKTRIFMNVMIKILYIVVNIAAFLIINGTLNGRFTSYGSDWITWAKLENALAYDYMGQRGYPKPGNALLPSFALCEVHESAQDIKHVITNKHKFVCELSQHILYQYVFIVLWFAMMGGMFVSACGLLLQILDHCLTITCFLRNGNARKLYKTLTLRECEYLEYIRRTNLALYGQVLQKLKEQRFDPDQKQPGSYDMSTLA